MDQPIQLRIVELQALLELLEQNARKIEKLALVYRDPRVQKDCRSSYNSVYSELESVRQELRKLQSAAPLDYAPQPTVLTDKPSFGTHVN